MSTVAVNVVVDKDTLKPALLLGLPIFVTNEKGPYQRYVAMVDGKLCESDDGKTWHDINAMPAGPSEN